MRIPLTDTEFKVSDNLSLDDRYRAGAPTSMFLLLADPWVHIIRVYVY